jgi:hypothetical protein
MTDSTPSGTTPADATPSDSDSVAPAPVDAVTTEPVYGTEQPLDAAAEPTDAGTGTAAPRPVDAVAPVIPPQSSLASRGVSYSVDIVFCIDVTGSMDPILDAVKANALGFYDDVQTNLVAKGKNVSQLRVRVVAFRDLVADGDAAIEESPFFALPDDRALFSEFVGGLTAEGGGDAPESGLEAVALAINSPWTKVGDRRRQVIVVWSDQPTTPLDASTVPADLSSRIPADFSALTDAWEDEQGVMGSSSKRLILFAPDGPGWSDISAAWENVVHNPSTAGGGLSDVDYGTIIDSIGNSV